MMSDAEMFTSRTALLLGEDVMHRLAETKVIVFGVGGVGSWCAECLVRSGIRQLTIVDYDLICMSNCNRQLMATGKTIGMAKVDVLKQRLLDISPDADIRAMRMAYSAENAHEFHLEHYDYVIDAIDSLKDKANLILHATSVPSVTLYSSMGAALRTDPFRVSKTEFYNVIGDPLARALRQRFKHNKTYPARKFQCVYSKELPMENKGNILAGEDGKRINGSLNQVTAVFGFSLAGMVINDIRLKC